jgi:DNA-binding MarR family transcriptional regulator
MITSGTMTNRIDRLEHRRFVRRRKDPDDGRVVLVSLTPAGRRRVDAALEAHAANELDIVSCLSQRDRNELIRVLRRLHLALDNRDDSGRAPGRRQKAGTPRPGAP